jgi:hypothetical protein
MAAQGDAHKAGIVEWHDSWRGQGTGRPLLPVPHRAVVSVSTTPLGVYRGFPYFSGYGSFAVPKVGAGHCPPRILAAASQTCSCTTATREKQATPAFARGTGCRCSSHDEQLTYYCDSRPLTTQSVRLLYYLCISALLVFGSFARDCMYCSTVPQHAVAVCLP